MDTKLNLKGIVPVEPPVILCRDAHTQQLVMHTLHTDWSRTPTTTIPDEWPEAWRNVSAVVMTPLIVLGVEKQTSFAILGDREITKQERKVLDAYITIMRTGSFASVTYRDLATATGLDRRTITKLVKSLADKGVGTYKFREGFSFDIGRWMLDAEKAKAQGVQIKEY